RVSGRKARAADHAKTAANNCRAQTRISEVRMVEEIESLKPEFMTDPLGNFGHFGDGKVEVLETRSDNRIPSHVAEVHTTESGQLELRPCRASTGSTRIANRIGREPLDTAVGSELVDDNGRRQKIRTEIAHASQRAVCHRDIQRVSAL